VNPETGRVAMHLIDPPDDPHREGMDDESLGQLADSLAHEGLHQPIGLLRREASERFTIIFGHRRYCAASLCRWREIDARIYPAGTDVLLARATENNAREQLSPVEEAKVVKRFLDRGESLAATGRLLRRSAAWIGQRLALLDYPEDLLHAVHSGQLSLAVAAELAQVDHEPYRRQLVDEAMRTGAKAPTAAVWVAHFLADRDRIVQNFYTVAEIIERRDSWRVTVACDFCRAEQGYDETRAWRLCLACHNGLVEMQRDHQAEAVHLPNEH
jgi:ParB/RepB/Spo0J family partition protein